MTSVDTGSEDVSELFCQPCADDGDHLPADGYCTDCQEYLCSTCFTHHRVGRAYKKHILQNKSEMPKSQTSSVMVDKCTEQCHQHKGEILRFYCKSHDLIGCQRCKAVGHIGCQVIEIADISKDITESTEYKELIEKLLGLRHRYGHSLGVSKKHVEEVEIYYSKAMEAFKSVIIKLKEEDLGTMKAIASTSSAVMAEIHETTTKLETLQNINQNSQMFVVMKKASSQIKMFKDSLSKVEADNKILRYEFRVMEQLDKNQDMLGQLCMLPVSLGDINVKTSSDTSSSAITGSCLLSDNRLVIVDCNNKNIKLLDLEQNKIASKLQLTSCPLDVTMIDNTQVAVTLYGDNKIQIIHTTSSSLSKGRAIKIDGSCHGIVHNDGTLIVTLSSPGRVEMMDMNGNVFRSVTQDSSGTQLFDRPKYIAISPDKTAIYVSDASKSTVTCMSMDGTVKSVYKDDTLKSTQGLAVDETGVAYVCGHGSSNIHQVTAECTKIRVLLGQKHGISSPYSVTYSDRDETVYVGMGGNNVVKVFKVK